MKTIMHLMAAPWRALIKSRMRHANLQLAQYLINEYGLTASPSYIADTIAKDGFNETISRLNR